MRWARLPIACTAAPTRRVNPKHTGDSRLGAAAPARSVESRMSAQSVGASRPAGFLRCMLHPACFYVPFCMLLCCMRAYFTSASPCRSELPLSVSIAGHSHSRCYRSVSPSRLTIAPTDAESAVAAASSGVQPSSPCGSGATQALCEASCTRQPCEAPSRRPRALSRKLSRGCRSLRAGLRASAPRTACSAASGSDPTRRQRHRRRRVALPSVRARIDATVRARRAGPMRV